MTTEIYYFSGTGNSLHVARELQNRIPGAELLPMVDLVGRKSVVAKGDTVGFVFPHYASSLPTIVKTFVEKLDLGSADYLFAIATRGGTQTMAFSELDKVLKKKGRRLDSFFLLTMPAGSEPLVARYDSMITEERIGRLESEMLARLVSIQRTITHREVHRNEDIRAATPPPTLLAPFVPVLEAVRPLLVPLGRRVETSFSFYHDEKCTGCGLCEQVCLSQRVRLVDGRPLWREQVPCFGCFACLNYCPEESVQVESKWYLKSHTRTNSGYHHPAITANDIAGQKRAQLA